MDRIPPTREAADEALALSDEILRDIELSQVPLSAAALKASRLARLLNEQEASEVFFYEASGYPTTPDGFAPGVWEQLRLGERIAVEKNGQGENTERAFPNSIEELEQQVAAAKLALEVAKDRDVSISSANPNQTIVPPIGNHFERQNLQNDIATATRRLSSRRALIYRYATNRCHRLRFSGVASDIFDGIRQRVDRDVGALVPEAVQKFDSVYENLRSENPEDWANAAHSCRRILQALADAVFPAQDEPRVKDDAGAPSQIKLGPDRYINRLMCFIEDRSDSERFAQVAGSDLRYIGERLDAVFGAAQKGSHAAVGRDEANRYVIATYLVVGDVLNLTSERGEEMG